MCILVGCNVPRTSARGNGRWAKVPRRRFVHGCAADPLRHRPSVSGQEKPHTTRPSDPPNPQEPPSEAPQSHRVNPLKSQAERPAGHHPAPLTTHRGKKTPVEATRYEREHLRGRGPKAPCNQTHRVTCALTQPVVCHGCVAENGVLQPGTTCVMDVQC